MTRHISCASGLAMLLVSMIGFATKGLALQPGERPTTIIIEVKTDARGVPVQTKAFPVKLNRPVTDQASARQAYIQGDKTEGIVIRGPEQGLNPEIPDQLKGDYLQQITEAQSAIGGMWYDGFRPFPSNWPGFNYVYSPFYGWGLGYGYSPFFYAGYNPYGYSMYGYNPYFYGNTYPFGFYPYYGYNPYAANYWAYAGFPYTTFGVFNGFNVWPYYASPFWNQFGPYNYFYYNFGGW